MEEANNLSEAKCYKSRLKIKFIFGIMLIVLSITAATVIIGARTYWNSTTKHYNTVAYQVAEVAAGYFTEEDLRQYAKLVTDYNRGTAGREQLDEAENSRHYHEIWMLLDNLRKGMGANDIYVNVFDIDLLKNFDEEEYKAKKWNPLYYIMDSYYKEEEQFKMGEAGTFVADYREDTIKAYETGQHMEQMIITNWQFGYILTASYPVAYDGETIAFVTVELPMTTLQSDIRNFAGRVIVVAGIITVIVMTVGIMFIVRTMIRPVLYIASEAVRFSDDHKNISTGLDGIKTHDEIQILSQSLLKLERDINIYIDNLTEVTAEKERIGAELNVATQIQADMLPGIFPAFPERKEFDIYATMTPAKEVGGDFYDFFLIDDDHLGIVMADVSGKGVPAALFMVIAKTLIKNRAQFVKREDGNYSPAEILGFVNEQLCEGNEAELFVTVWFGIMQISTGKGIAANAGHEYPAVRRAGGKYELIKTKHSPAVAVMEGLRFREHEFELASGDSLYVYTDGVPEAANAEEELFGTGRMLEALNKEPKAPAKELLQTVKESIDVFVGDAPQFDDITMLSITYFGRQEEWEEEYKLTVEAKVENLQQVLDFVNEKLSLQDCDNKTMVQFAVAVEEIYVNIAHYAYPDNAGDAEIRVRIHKNPVLAEIVFVDRGIPYNPLKKKDPDTTLSAEEREIGGLGIYMVKKSMDQTLYEYKDGQNILTIMKKL